ncbi:MAG: phasin family protein [Beijerinckiaceae bacterium]|nr:phasin family protein [Beijerinckiaceae bacterium]
MARRSKAAAPATGDPGGEEFREESDPNYQDADCEAAPDVQPDPVIPGVKTVESSEVPALAAVEAATTPELEVLEVQGNEGLEAAEAAASSLAATFRKFANETAGYSKESLDIGYAFAGELRQAKSVVAALQIQVDFAKLAYVRLLDHLVTISGIYWKLASEAPVPARNAAAK